MTKTHPRRARAIAAITAVLPATKGQIRERTGLNHTTIIRVVTTMHQSGEMHISRWVPHPVHGPSMAVFALGPGIDAVDNLPRLTRKEIVRRYEARIKGTEKHDLRKSQHRSRHWEKKALSAPQTWASALLGPAKQGRAL